METAAICSKATVLVVFGHSRAVLMAYNNMKILLLAFGSLRAFRSTAVTKESTSTVLRPERPRPQPSGLTIAQASDTIASEAVHFAGGATGK